MKTHYPAKGDYHGDVAMAYDEQRFNSVKGRWLDRREKLSVTRALQTVDHKCTILDFPCGTGRITEHLLSLGYRVAGADISDDMIALARRRIGNHQRLIGFHQADAEHTGLKADSYDCITSVRLMGHLPDAVKAKVIREMARVARKFLIITFYQAGPVRSLKWFLTHGSLMRKSAWYPLRSRELFSLAQDCGVTPIRYWNVCPFLSDGVTHLFDVSRC